MQQYSKIAAIEYYVPKEIISNATLAKAFDSTEESILETTGIYKRHKTPANELSSDLAVKAAEKLFLIYPELRTQIDFLIFCTQSIDQPSPATSCLIQTRLKLNKSIGSIDIGHGCSGFMYCLSIAKALIECNQVKNVLILTAETLTKYLASNDKSTRYLFGDAGCATWVSTSNTPKIGNFTFGTDGSGADTMYCKYRSLRHPINDENDLNYFKMNGFNVLAFSLKEVQKLFQDIISKNHLTSDLSEIDWIVLHQASKIVLESLQKKLKYPTEKYLFSLEQFGNTVSSSIPITLKYNMENSLIKENNHLLLAAFGVGFSWCGTVIYL